MSVYDPPELSPEARALTHDPALLISGAPCPGGGEEMVSVDPFTEVPLGRIATASPEQVQEAIAAASAAFDSGVWSETAPADRRRILLRALDSLSRQRDALVELMVAETGCPVSVSRALQVDAMLEHLAWFAEAAGRGPRGGFEQGLPVHRGSPLASAGVVVREPIGVVAAITPYNIPLLTAVWKVAAALAAGCTALLVPSPQAPLVSLAWARALLE